MADVTTPPSVEASPTADESPFKPARITEGYPFDETDQQVIRRILEDVRQRQQPSDGRHR